MGKKLKPDDIKATMSVNSNPAQSSIRKLQDITIAFRKENDALALSMAKMSARGEDNTKKYREMETQIKSNNNTIKENEKTIAKLTSELKINEKTMSQLRKDARNLQAQMDQLDPKSKEWNKLNKEFQTVRARMKEIQKESYDTTGFITRFAQTVNKYWSVIGGGLLIAKKGYDLANKAMMSNKKTGDELKATMEGISELSMVM